MTVSFEGQQEEGERIQFEPIEELWTKYKLTDGTVIRMKLVVADVVRLSKKTQAGEPVYIVKSSNIMAVEEPGSD